MTGMPRSGTIFSGFFASVGPNSLSSCFWEASASARLTTRELGFVHNPQAEEGHRQLIKVKVIYHLVYIYSSLYTTGCGWAEQEKQGCPRQLAMAVKKFQCKMSTFCKRDAKWQSGPTFVAMKKAIFQTSDNCSDCFNK